MQRFESLLLASTIILGTPVEAGLNQKNSTSLTLGTQTAFDFYPPENFGGQAPRYNRRLNPKMLNGARKNLPNLLLSFVSCLWDTALVAISKMQTPFKDKPTTTTADKAWADPPSLKKLWRDRR